MALDSETLDAILTPMEETNSPSVKRPPKKIYVPIRIQTNALNNDDIAINATYISIENLPATRKKRNKAGNIEIRYLESIRSLRNKIKSSYSCNQDHCPLIKERRDHHQKEHHQVESRQSGNLSNSLANCCSHHDRQSQTNFQPTDSTQDTKETSQLCVTLEPPDKKSVAITPAASILKRTSHSMQTPAKSVDFSHPIQSSFDNEFCRSDGQTQYKNDSNSKPLLVEKETTNTPNNSFLKSDLVVGIQNWFEDIPVYPNLSSTSKHLRKTMVNEFIDKIFELSNDADRDSYEDNVKIEIDNLLNTLPMWYPGAKRDQDVLKEKIRNNLLGKIKKLRSKNRCEAEAMPYVSGIMINKDENIIGVEDSNRLRKFTSEGKEKLIESQVLDWLMQIKIQENTEIVRPKNIIEAANIFTKRLIPLLDKPSCSKNYKLTLKGLIVDTLNDLPNLLHIPKHKIMYLNRIAEDLSNRLISIQSEFENSFDGFYPKERSTYQLSVCSKAHFKKVLLGELYEYLEKVSPEHRDDVKEDITEILIDCLESISLCGNIENRNELIDTVFPNSAEISETQPSNITTRNIREQTDNIMQKTDHLNNLERSCHSGVLAVFKSEHELTGKYPVSSTPKQKISPKEISRLNKEEISYMDDIGTLIRVWMETLPRKFDEKENGNFKETIIRDLAGDIMDQVKIEQLAPKARSDRDKYMFYIIFRWLYRFDGVEDLNDANPYVEDLVQKLHDVLVPTLTRSQRGSRQAMANIKHMEGENAWKDDFVPTGLDILQDEISIWMNEQPSTIYSKTDKDFREKMVHELAETIQIYLISKKPEQEIVDELSKWLRKMLKSSENNKISKLAENLKVRIVKLPQDATLAGNMQKKIQQRGEAAKPHCDPCKCANTKTSYGPTIDPDRTLIEFINKFMERNYEVDNSLARNAFEELLKTEFRKLDPPTRKEVYDNFSKSTGHDKFSPDRLEKELQYIKDVSDWLKNIPIDSYFNMPQNKQRTEFVNDLARNIYEVEESRRKEPTAMDYNMYLASIISQFTDQLPILPEHTGNVMLMIDQLVGKIVAGRTPMPCCQNAFEENTSFSSTGIQEQSITEFIDKYIHLNAGKIADDPVKLEAWSARMLKEVKKIVRDTADPSTLCKTQVYNNLINVPIPEDETVRIFGLELDYAKEISDWLHNLPLLAISSPEASERKVKMISDLAEMFAERERNKVANPTQEQPIDKIEEYIENWIHQLPLDSNREIVMPLVIKQLTKRINRVNIGPEEIVLPEVSPAQSTTTPKKSKSKAKIKKSCNPSCSISRPKTKHSGQIIVDAIENWSKNLPVTAENADTEKEIKDKVTRKLFQKVGELNDDPVIMNNDILYEELLSDEVNLQLNSLPQTSDMEKKKENLKNDIVVKVMEAKSLIKENVAGEKYKHQLENTIDASIPNPIINKQWHDPGFEIYRDRLADMFILENCDHGSDDVKANYEKRIKTEINKYFQDAQKRNAAPLSRDQIYNELYGALFKVPMPSEYSSADEVERIKTRCELDEWLYGLPIREPLNIEEILEKEKILSMLSKRLHEIEKGESKPDEKIHQEITKWIRKLPLLPGNESSIDNFAAELENKLKSTKEDRKYVPALPLNPMGSKVKNGKKSKEKEHKGSKTKGVLGTSQVAGPSSAGHMWTSPSPAGQSCCQSSTTPRKKPAEIIFALVEHWSENLPFYKNTPKEVENNKVIRDDLVTKIIMKLSELNSDPRTFSDDMLYNYLFDQHLEKIMANLPICCDFQKTKDAKKLELIEAVNSVKPLIKEDRARHEYKKELKTTVNSILKEPLDTTADKIAMFQEIREEIVNNFVQYNYNIDDDEGKQIYKTKLREAVTKYFLEVKDSPDDPPVDPLVRQNQLLCELAKIEIPGERAVKDEVEEIRMKDEVRQFFDELTLPEENEEKMAIRNKIMLSLGKRLNEIEKTGLNCKNAAKMKKEIERYLKKLNLELDQETIQSFIDKLKITEAWRKAPPLGKTETCYNPKVFHQTHLDSGPHDYGHSGPNNQTDNLVVNLIPPTQTTEYFPTQDTDTNNRQGSVMPCPQGCNNAKSLGVTPEYEGFGGGVALSSSPQPTDHQLHDLPAKNKPQNLVNQSHNSPEAPNSDVPTQDATTQGMRRRFETKKRNRRPGTTSKEEVTDEECNCMFGRRKLKGRPRCVLKRPAFCDDCDDYGRMWIPMPPYKYPPGYFYY